MFRPFLTAALAVQFLLPSAAFAVVAGVPRGFTQVARAQGVMLLQRRRDYVQVVSPRDGARIAVLHGKFLETGIYGAFLRHHVSDWWAQWSDEPAAFSLVNGQFFDTSEAELAPLAFSIKADGRVYEGYADATEFPGDKRMLLLGDAGYRVDEYDDDPVSLLSRPEANILVGLSPTASKSFSRPLPRTFIGTTRDGRAVIFSSSMASQAYAIRTMRAFGVQPYKIVMFDGGTSSHLVHDGRTLVPRTIQGKSKVARERLPQMIGVQAGTDVSRRED
jgi:hypothetical protein